MGKSKHLSAGVAFLLLCLCATPGLGGTCSTSNEICRDRCYDKYNSGLYRQSCLENCDSAYEECTWDEHRTNKQKAEIEKLERQIQWTKLRTKAQCIQNCRLGDVCLEDDLINCSLCLAGC